jgi:hypothetical protein
MLGAACFATISLRFDLRQSVERTANATGSWHFAFSSGPAFALSRAIAVGFFSLVVKQNLLRREGQIDPVCCQRVFDIGQNSILKG